MLIFLPRIGPVLPPPGVKQQKIQRKVMKDVRESNMVKFTQLRVKPLPSPLSHTTELNTSW